MDYDPVNNVIITTESWLVVIEQLFKDRGQISRRYGIPVYDRVTCNHC